jgi:Ca-activated chloride channel family protein
MPTDLHLLRPEWLLALPPLLLLWVWLARQARARRCWEDLIDPHLRDAVLTAERQASFKLPLLVLGLGWILLVTALSGPVWQRELRPVYRVEQPRVLLLDLSDDMRPRPRGDAQGTEQGSLLLERARFEIMDLLRGADEGQIALIGYGAEPFVIAPLTTDAATIIEQVPVLAPDLLPLTGPGRVDLALDMAAGLLRPSGAAQGDVILVAGGLPDPDAALEAAARLRADGHRLSVLAVANVPAFAQLASAGGGLLLPARADGLDTDRLLALAGKRVPTPSGDRIITDAQWRDEGYWLLLLLLPMAALAFRRGWLGLLPLALLLNPPSLAQAWSWQDLWLRPEQQALRMLEDGHLSAVDERFDDPRWRAAAYYRAGRYRQALAALAEQRGAEAHYNRGNTLARLRRYDDAIAEYDAALLIDPVHEDARFNRDLLLSRIGSRPYAAASGVSEPDSKPDSKPDAKPDAKQMPSRRRNKPPPSPQMRTPPVTANRQTNPAPAPVTKLIIVTSASCLRRALQRRLRICRAATTRTPRPRERLLARVSMSALSSVKRRP